MTDQSGKWLQANDKEKNRFNCRAKAGVAQRGQAVSPMMLKNNMKLKSALQSLKKAWDQSSGFWTEFNRMRIVSGALKPGGGLVKKMEL
ncbi:hypothetical protein Pla110_36510 [Polystyrenella longa]|uniref:Uncharacterized protein n=1 Tax=Polystyrenella longa TaxID=2528007 RepID=A0A518CRR1_9PLAN|nr:hypothetical protein Pla110_36510 [Polystyrenella longa]